MREELELFAHNLNVYMDKYGYNQTTLANKIGVGVTTVSDWVHGRKFPRIDKIDMLCKLFHCNRSDLLEKYTTEETIAEADRFKRLMAYYNALNELGKQNLERFMEDTHPKYKKDGDSDVQ